MVGATGRESLPNGGFFVDIGEETLFYVEMDDVRSYVMMHTSSTSVLVKASLTTGEEIVIRVSWSAYKRVACGKGYAGMEVCESLPFVPSMYSRELHIVGRTYVDVMTREYMPGSPLSDVWCLLCDAEKKAVVEDVSAACRQISRNTSSMFMRLQGRNLATSGPVRYLNYRVLLSMITRSLKKGDMKTVCVDEFPAVPALAHHNLSMDHVLVQDGRLSGIVGWSQCDYVPEVADRLRYHFAQPQHAGEEEWYEIMSRMPFLWGPPPPLYTVACMYYHYYLRRNNTPECYHSHVDSLLGRVSETLLMPAGQAEPPCRGEHGRESDQWSPALHTDRPSSHGASKDNPFSDEADTTQRAPSVDTWENWEDSGTIEEVLDSLSVS